MPTQLSATPTLHGKEAKKVLRESKRMPTEKSRKGLKVLREMFEKQNKRDNK